MGTTRRLAPRCHDPLSDWIPARTPGSLGRWDGADREVLGLPGDTPGRVDAMLDHPPLPNEPRLIDGPRDMRTLSRDAKRTPEDQNRHEAVQLGWEIYFASLSTVLGIDPATLDMSTFVEAVKRLHWIEKQPADPPILDAEQWARLRFLLGITGNPGKLPPSSLPGFSTPEEKALRITSAFETGQPLNFGAVAGNFDGQGISLGLLQWNLGTGSLQPLLRDFATQNPAQVDAIFGAAAGQFRNLLGMPHADQLQFAQSISGTGGAQLVPTWQNSFAQLANDPGFRQVQLRTIRTRMDATVKQTRELQFKSERGLVLMFDIICQHGEFWRKRSNRGGRFLDETAGRELMERERLLVLAEILAETTPDRFRADVRARREAIVFGRGQVHGRLFDLTRDFGLTDFPFE